MDWKVKLTGHIIPDGGALWMVSSGAEAGFRVVGAKRLCLKLLGDDTVADPAAEPLRPRYAVRLDGKKITDARLSQAETVVTVFEGEEPRDAEVRLIKLSEGSQSLMALEEILTDGRAEPLPAKGLRMEFIGDSITCGYGVEGKNELETFTTATENLEKSYAGLTAAALDADAVYTCFSGYGLVSGYTGDPSVRNGDELLPPYYEKEGRNAFRLPSGRLAQEIGRDFEAFRPDYIVLNLGTNDLSWCGTDRRRGETFAREYARFLTTVRRNNPEARILCVLGVMGTGLNETMRQAAEEWRRETGDRALRVLLTEEQNAARDGYGSDFHPNETTQRLLAGKVMGEIRKWMET